jgi:hypothetical protein
VNGGQLAITFTRLVYTPTGAAEACSVSDDFFRVHIAPELRWTRLGRKKLVTAQELTRFFEERAASTFGDES